MTSESTFMVPLTKIKAVRTHPNAHSLDIATVFGFDVVCGKDVYKTGDLVIYIPIDSILPPHLESALFPWDSKIKLSKSRVKQIRIRKFPSQGMLVHPRVIEETYGFRPTKMTDYSKKLGIVKHEPPAPKTQMQGQSKKKSKDNPKFSKYNGLNNFKWMPDKFQIGEQVTIQEKIHGTNARAGLLPYHANTWWKKIKKLFGLTPKYEFCYGSNNVQLSGKSNKSGYYGEDVYGRVFSSLNIEAKLLPGEQIFGEIYGDGIQKGYAYGCKQGELKFVLFDVKMNGKWLDPDEVRKRAEAHGLRMIPELFRGPFNPEAAKELTLGDSVLAPSQKVREGVVIKSILGYNEGCGSKRALKMISEKYLDKDQTDFH
jgi:RNA ligase (TIGR02306 family)